MSENYAPPNHVIEEWLKVCDCCRVCGDAPCDGVAAGGMCDQLECRCHADFSDADDEGLFYSYDSGADFT